jgi:tetratricopeptide (TPR) repeat protein
MIVVLVLLGLVGSVLGAEADVISQAESLFELGEYAEGVELLTATRDNEGLSSEQRCNILVALADTHAEYTGDYSAALDCYRLVLAADVLPGHASKSSARPQMMRIESFTRKYAEQNTVIEEIAKSASEKAGEHIGYLEEIAAKSGDYYRLAEVYYYLGAGYASLGENERAAESLAKALELKPGLGAWLPVDEQVETVEEKLKSDRVQATGGTNGTRGIDRQRYIVSGVLLILAVIVLFVAKPWRRGKVES